jgi:hypothetical protein
VKHIWLTSIAGVVCFGWGAVCHAQISDQELQRRMEEMNKRATTRPATVAKAPITPPQQRFFKWRAKPNAPQAVKDWVASFDVLRGALISEIDAELESQMTSGNQ